MAGYREELLARLATLEEAVFGPKGIDEALRPIEWVEDLARWATEMAAKHPVEVEDPDALWTCIGEVRKMVRKLAAARDEDTQTGAGVKAGAREEDER